jgi:hypothetical protein
MPQPLAIRKHFRLLFVVPALVALLQACSAAKDPNANAIPAELVGQWANSAERRNRSVLSILPDGRGSLIIHLPSGESPSLIAAQYDPAGARLIVSLVEPDTGEPAVPPINIFFKHDDKAKTLTALDNTQADLRGLFGAEPLKHIEAKVPNDLELRIPRYVVRPIPVVADARQEPERQAEGKDVADPRGGAAPLPVLGAGGALFEAPTLQAVLRNGGLSDHEGKSTLLAVNLYAALKGALANGNDDVLAALKKGVRVDLPCNRHKGARAIYVLAPAYLNLGDNGKASGCVDRLTRSNAASHYLPTRAFLTKDRTLRTCNAQEARQVRDAGGHVYCPEAHLTTLVLRLADNFADTVLQADPEKRLTASLVMTNPRQATMARYGFFLLEALREEDLNTDVLEGGDPEAEIPDYFVTWVDHGDDDPAGNRLEAKLLGVEVKDETGAVVGRWTTQR